MEMKILIQQVFLASWKLSIWNWISSAILVVLTSDSDVYENIDAIQFWIASGTVIFIILKMNSELLTKKQVLNN